MKPYPPTIALNLFQIAALSAGDRDGCKACGGACRAGRARHNFTKLDSQRATGRTASPTSEQRSPPNWAPKEGTSDAVPALQTPGRPTSQPKARRRVTLLPHDVLLTTQQAAEILNVSRPDWYLLIEQHSLPVVMVGSHRRLRIHDLLQLRDERHRSATSPSQSSVNWARRCSVIHPGSS